MIFKYFLKNIWKWFTFHNYVDICIDLKKANNNMVLFGLIPDVIVAWPNSPFLDKHKVAVWSIMSWYQAVSVQYSSGIGIGAAWFFFYFFTPKKKSKI